MRLLAFETATEACSVAIWVDGAVRERYEVAPRRHAALALPWAEALLAEAGVGKAQLDAIAVSRGPGAFTGVRLGIAVAQGIALALDRPVVAVSTLAVLAASAGVSGSAGDAGSRRILAAIDARMGEVYAGAFEHRDRALVAASPETVGAPDAVAVPGDSNDWQGVGTGFAAADGRLAHRLRQRLVEVDAGALPHAADLARLAVEAYARGQGCPPERIEPAYLRDNVAMTLAEQQARKST